MCTVKCDRATRPRWELPTSFCQLSSLKEPPCEQNDSAGMPKIESLYSSVEKSSMVLRHCRSCPVQEIVMCASAPTFSSAKLSWTTASEWLVKVHGSGVAGSVRMVSLQTIPVSVET